MTLQEWIEGLVEKRYGTTRALAVAIGMTESGFSRAVKAGTFEVENCLRLAQETGASAETVFALTGKSHVHTLIEGLYGRAHGPQDPDAVKASAMIQKIEDADAREGLLMMMRGYLKAQRRAATETAPVKIESRRR